MTKARDLANGATALSAVSATELAYLDGVTSAVQTQIDGKQAVNAAVSTTELGYLDGVTSAIQTQLDAKTAKSTLTTTGDIYYASAANTPARLGIGSTNQVLKVTGGVPVWATASSGALTLIQRSSFSNVAGTTTTFDGVFTSTYKTYFVNIETVYGGTGADDLQLQLIYSGTTQAANYYTANFYANYSASAMSFMGENNTSQIPLTSHVGDSADGTAGQLYFNLVGNSSQRALINGNFMNSNAISQQTMAAVAYQARTYTGFLLKSASSNITGTVAVYGLATS